jgi:hypothetical protein
MCSICFTVKAVRSVVGKAKCAFTKTAVKRALEGAKEAGVPVQIVIDQERKTMTLTPVKIGEVDCSGSNPWDEVLDNATNQKRAS